MILYTKMLIRKGFCLHQASQSIQNAVKVLDHLTQGRLQTSIQRTQALDMATFNAAAKQFPHHPAVKEVQEIILEAGIHNNGFNTLPMYDFEDGTEDLINRQPPQSLN